MEDVQVHDEDLQKALLNSFEVYHVCVQTCNTQRCVENIVRMFPDVCSDWLSNFLEEGFTVEETIDYILENYETDMVPKLKMIKDGANLQTGGSSNEEAGHNETEANVSREEVANLLEVAAAPQLEDPEEQENVDFDAIGLDMEHYARIVDGWTTQMSYMLGDEANIPMKQDLRNSARSLLEKISSLQNIIHNIEKKATDPIIDWLFMWNEVNKTDETRTLEFDSLTFEENTEGQDISTEFECPVCFDTYSVEESVECKDVGVFEPCTTGYDKVVHMFCVGCVQQMAKASLFDGLVVAGGLGLPCLQHQCHNIITSGVLRYILSAEDWSRLENRLDAEAIIASGCSEEIERCIKCDWAVILIQSKEEMPFLACNNCQTKHCRDCKKEWTAGHANRKCHEVMNAKDFARVELEGQLNEAVIHQCPKCFRSFEKEAGCNKIQCLCGTSQCYACRKIIAGYDHFCNHITDPGTRECGENCGRCMLHADIIEKDQKNRHDILATAKAPEDVMKSLRKL